MPFIPTIFRQQHNDNGNEVGNDQTIATAEMTFNDIFIHFPKEKIVFSRVFDRFGRFRNFNLFFSEICVM